jgi:hypothetical protein
MEYDHRFAFWVAGLLDIKFMDRRDLKISLMVGLDRGPEGTYLF